MKEANKTQSEIKKRQLVGTVVSTKMQNAVAIKVVNKKLHPLYKKVVNRFRRYMAQNSIEGLNVGDRVRIVESRPLSRRIRWIVVEKLDK